MFAGGIGSVMFDQPGGTFLPEGDVGSTTLLTLLEHQMRVEGQQWPAPELVKDQVGNGQGAPTGERVPFAFKAINVDAVKADTLRNRAFSLLAVDVQFTSKDGKTVVVMSDVLLGVQTTPIIEFGKYGFVLFDGEGLAAGADRAMDITTT